MELEQELAEVMMTAYTICNGDLNLWLETGFGVKNKPTSITEINAPALFSVEAGTSGQLVIKYNPISRARAYQVWIGTDASNLKLHTTLTGRRLFIDGLTPGMLYYVALKL